jgi:aldose 1-epimerase
MVPYANRIAGGRFTVHGQRIFIPPNWSGSKHPLHGQGWLTRWTVIESSATRATLEFEGGGNDWPWRYRARQYFELSPHALGISLSVENLSASPMPAMLGLHPYFPQGSIAQVQVALDSVWQSDEDNLPLRETPVPAEWSFKSMRAIGDVVLDHCFTGWNGTAKITWPSHSLQLYASNCRFLHIYSPPRADYFCLEPQTCAAGALNRDDSEVPLLLSSDKILMHVAFKAEKIECF